MRELQKKKEGEESFGGEEEIFSKGSSIVQKKNGLRELKLDSLCLKNHVCIQLSLISHYSLFFLNIMLFGVDIEGHWFVC